jgi:hypothetical protein
LFFFEASTSTTTTLPLVQVGSPSDIIKHCEQSITVGTLLTTVDVAVVFAIVFSKLAVNTFKPSSIPS